MGAGSVAKKGMRILLLNYEYPPLGGGAGVISQNIVRQLVDFGHQVTVLTTWFRGEKEDFKKGGLRVIRLKSIRHHAYESNPLEMLSWILHAKRYLATNCRTYDYDLSFANFLLPGGEVSRFLLKRFGIPFVAISHGHDIPFAFPRQMLKFHLPTYFWLKIIYNKAERFFVQTSEMKRNADIFGSRMKAKNVKIPNGCDVEFFRPEFSKRKGAFKIIFVGRLVQQKDPMTFLKALKVLHDRDMYFLVDILGDGPLRQKMKRFVTENGLSDKVTFRGWVDKLQMLESYQSAALQVMASLFEGMSITALESLCTGQYLISTPVSGAHDVIEPGINGDIFDYGDYRTLAEKIHAFKKEKFSHGFRVDEAKLALFREKYSWPNIVRSYEKALAEAIHR